MGFLAQFSSILNKKNWFSFTASQYRKNQNSAQGPKLVESFQLTFSAATTWSYIYLIFLELDFKNSFVVIFRHFGQNKKRIILFEANYGFCLFLKTKLEKKHFSDFDGGKIKLKNNFWFVAKIASKGVFLVIFLNYLKNQKSAWGNFEPFSGEINKYKDFRGSEKWKIIYLKMLVYSAAKKRTENWKH